MAAPLNKSDGKKSGKDFPRSKRKLKPKSTVSDSDNNENPKKKLKWSNYSVAEFKVEIKDPNLTFQGKHVNQRTCWRANATGNYFMLFKIPIKIQEVGNKT